MDRFIYLDDDQESLSAWEWSIQTPLLDICVYMFDGEWVSLLQKKR